jgi:acyl-CoA synthetase (AMP-forming)/AMP-acid ligase II
MNLTEPILRHARMQPQAVALIEGERTMSYAVLADRILHTAGHLAALGVRPGDRVGLGLKDDSECVIALLAIARLGALAVQIDWRSRSEEKERLVKVFAPKLLLVAPGSNIVGPCPIVVLDADWHKSVAAAEIPSAMPGDWNSPVALLGTSGTTGLPKFAVATHLHLFLHLCAYQQAIPSLRRYRSLLTLPLYFGAGRMVCMGHLLRGDTVILYPTLFTASEYVDVATRYKAEIGFVAPSVVRQLLALAGGRGPLLPGLEVLLVGGAPLFADEKLSALREISPNLCEMYGVTPVGPVSVIRPHEIAERPTSVGRPFSLVDLEVVNENNKPVGADVVGRLRCRGPALTSPVTKPGLGSAADDFRDGWYYPDELVSFDSSGYLFIEGRTSDVVFRGGAKIFPAEIEAVLQAHDAVLDAAVLGRRGPDNEEHIIAYVTVAHSVSPGDLLAHCRSRLASNKVPREIHIVSELPRLSSGKLDKRTLVGTLAEPRSP